MGSWIRFSSCLIFELIGVFWVKLFKSCSSLNGIVSVTTYSCLISRDLVLEMFEMFSNPSP